MLAKLPVSKENQELSLQNTLLPTSFDLVGSKAFQAAKYHLNTGGSRVRFSIVKALSERLNIAESDSIKLASSVELLHNASIVHDDLMDKDAYRRSVPTVWSKFGQETAICCGDLFISSAFLHCSRLDKQNKIGQCIQLLSQSIEKTIYGQCLDVDHQAWSCLDNENYCKSVIQKTIPLLVLSFELPLAYSGIVYPSNQVRETVTHFALAYQILDDIEDRVADEEVGRSNYISLLSQTMNSHEAEAMACEKARYLIRQCETHDRRLPEFATGILMPGIKQLNSKLDRLSKSQ